MSGIGNILVIEIMNNIYIGLMTGTSVDAIDISAVRIEKSAYKIIDSKSYIYPEEIRNKVLAISRREKPFDSESIRKMDHKIGEIYSESINNFIDLQTFNKNNIRAIGIHGQTIEHSPNAKVPRSLQIGNAELVAKNIGVTCIANFRNADIQAGGQGAPLAPIFHSWLFRSENHNIAVINIGGISNISILKNEEVSGYDLGPGNVLLDAWSQHNDKGEYDYNGGWAVTGELNNDLLDLLLKDEFIRREPPKSTGTDYYNLNWIQEKISSTGLTIKPADVQCTLTEYSARIILQSINSGIVFDQVILCGGGTKNSFLFESIKNKYNGKIYKTNDFGIDASDIESIGFAYLAYLRVKEVEIDLSKITGSSKKVLLGKVFSPDIKHD